LIKIFRGVKPEDWVLCSWRSHYHCLLKGVPPDELKAAILRGRSIALCFPKHKVLSSAIVGGICPWAVGLAWTIKRRGGSERVYAFIGDMTALTGIFFECEQYSCGHDLGVRWVVENNHKSVMTDTRKVWGEENGSLDGIWHDYTYEMTRPHVGSVIREVLK
jgi:pyruvate dehydrogenase E1 component alpha subunit